MAESVSVSRQEFNGRRELCDEREKRTNTRMKQVESSLASVTQNLDRAAATLDRISEGQEDHEKRLREIESSGVKQTGESQKDHESRLRALEGRGGKWLDILIGAALTAVVGGLIAIIISMLKQGLNP